MGFTDNLCHLSVLIMNIIQLTCSVFFLLQSRRFLRTLTVNKKTHPAPFCFALVVIDDDL